MNMEPVTIDAKNLHYTPLNIRIRELIAEGKKKIILNNICGQRFIGNGIRGDDVEITVNGVPGGDLGMFMCGPTIIVHGNCDHAPGNTMDSGKIVIHGSTGDATAHSMRGGEVFVKCDIGYRGGIHMKEYREKRPVLVVGGKAGSFSGEYMAGGLLIILGIGRDAPVKGKGIGSGIHGGKIIIRGDVDEKLLGIGAKKEPLTEDDRKDLEKYLKEYCRLFDYDYKELSGSGYTKIVPASARPFAGKYCWE
jgi:glutamate synthase domain-containing protein 3